MAQAITGGVDRDLAVTAIGATSQANSYGIAASITEFTTVALTTGARLPSDAMNGDTFVIANKGANPLLLYPPTGGTVNLQAANASVSIAPGGVAIIETITNLNFVATGVTAAGAAPIAAGATLTLTVAAHNGRTILLDTAAGSVVTLPPATGSMAVFKFVVSVIATSNSHTITCGTAAKYQGYIFTMSDDAGAAMKGYFAVAGTSTIITLNRTTTGSVTVGEEITITDIGVNRYQVSGFTSSTGTEATPFS